MTRDGAQPLQLGAEVALAAVTLAGALSVGRLLEGGGWFPALAGAAIGTHVLMSVLRRWGVGLLGAAALGAGALVLVVSWIGYGETAALGLPTGATWEALQTDLQGAWEVFRDVSPPAPAEPGFVLVAAVAVAFAAFVADWAAFRLWVPLEATLPAATLFLFAAVLGSERGRGPSTAVFAAAVLAFLLVHRTARQAGSGHWVAGRRDQGQRALLAVGVPLVVLAVVAGTLAGPRLPGADAEALIDTRRSLDEPGSRVTISPLVDIRSRMLAQAAVEVFTVRAQERAYWRLTSLERFDGRIWSSSGSFGRAGGSLPRGVGTAAPEAAVEQIFSIRALAQIWLPAAYEPRGLEIGGADIRFDEDSSTLIVDRELPSSDALTYRVVSAVPRFDAAQLRTASTEVPAGIAERYLPLPELAPEVVALAQGLVAGSPTPYDAALALQEHLRAFTYDLDVPPGHGGDDLVRFLFETQRGYCEQFAGAFAAMARAVGLPSRVAVGFTPGEVDPADATLFHVRGEHAHAWPEVYLGEYGWVAFEPTPGRGAPFAEAYTGVPEEQAATGDPGVATTLPPEASEPGQSGPEAPPPEAVPGEDQTDTVLPDLTGGDDEVAEPGAVERWAPRLRNTAAVVLLLAVLYLAGVPLLSASRRRSRRAAAGQDTGARVQVAWEEALEHLAVLGMRPARSATVAEVATAAAAVLPDAGDAARSLARVTEHASYGPDGLPAEQAATAEAAAGRIGAAVRERTTTAHRARHAWHPARVGEVLPRRGARRRTV
jgi:transglutaminase-like putative cysteine protease